jgi:hypothetical protein
MAQYHNLKLEDLAERNQHRSIQLPLPLLQDATNGIKEFFAELVHTQEICTTRSDGTEVCANADQLAALLSGTSAGAPASGNDGEGAPTSISAPPSVNADTATSTTPENSEEDADASEQGGTEAPASRPASSLGNDAESIRTTTVPDDPSPVPEANPHHPQRSLRTTIPHLRPSYCPIQARNSSGSVLT